MERKYAILWHDTIDSTNSEALRHLAEFDNLSVIAAKFQTAGRGQRGNRWTSSSDENLTFSIMVRPGEDGIPKIPAVRQFAISEIVTLALTDYLADNGIEAEIKWPNDIYCGDRKICGILIENSVRDSALCSSVIGIGLNLNQTEFPDNLPNPVSMKMLTAKEYVPEEELGNFLRHFDRHLAAASDDRLRELYLKRMYRKDSRHRFVDNVSGEEFSGTIRGISSTACLVVEMPSGNLKEFAFKEISYIL